jgi:YfiH family protein
MGKTIISIANPRSKIYPQFVSSITNEHIDPSHPKMTQIHSDRVVIVTSSDQMIWEADAMVTRLFNLELQVRTADCGNIHFLDPVSEIIGVCHSWRKGSHLNIIGRAIDTMISLWSSPADIYVRCGPCISWKNYQFWPEVKELFEEEYYTYRDGTYYLDLPKIHHHQLITSGIWDNHIIQSEICTFENSWFPSYRRDGADSGRMTWSIRQIL